MGSLERWDKRNQAVADELMRNPDAGLEERPRLWIAVVAATGLPRIPVIKRPEAAIVLPHTDPAAPTPRSPGASGWVSAAGPVGEPYDGSQGGNAASTIAPPRSESEMRTAAP